MVQVKAQRGMAEELAALLVQAADAGGQGLFAAEAAALVGDLPGGEAQAVGAAQAAIAVIERPGAHADRALGADHALLGIVEAGAVQGQWVVGDQSATLVDQCTGAGEVQGPRARQAARRVVQAGDVERQVAFAADQALEPIGQGIVEGDDQTRLGTQGAAAIVQAGAAEAGAALAAQLAQALVDDLGDLEAQRRVGEDLAAVAVVQARAGQAQVSAAGNLARAVVDLIDSEFQRFCRPYQAALAVIQGTAVEGQRAAGDQLAVLVVQAGDVRRHIELAGDRPVAVVQAVGGQQQRAVADQGAVLVGEGIGHPQVDRAPAADQALAVVQAGAAAVEGRGGNQAVEVAQRLGDAQGQALLAQQLAVAVIQALRRQGVGLGAGDFAVLVGHPVEVVQDQQRAIDHAVLVVQLAVVQVQVQAGFTEQFAALLVEAGDAGGQGLLAGDATALIGDLGGAQVQAVVTGQVTALAVVQGASRNAGRAGAVDHALLTVVEAGTGKGQALIREDRTALVEHRAEAGDRQGAPTAELARAVVQARGIDGQCTFAAEQPGVVEQCAIEADIQALEAGEVATAVIQGTAGQARGPLGEQPSLGLVDQLRHRQPEIGLGQQLATVAVVQALAGDSDTAGSAGEFAGPVVDLLDIESQVLGAGDRTAVAVVEGFTGQQQTALGHQRPALLVQAVDVGGEITLAGDATSDVGDFLRLEGHRADRTEQAAAVVQTGTFVADGGLADQVALVAVVQLIDQQLQVLVGLNHTTTVVCRGAAQGQ